ncbi:MAG: hypothetical protein IPL61_24150 [Myxococcales bacterium]|nr:hypothetical protein [Myxococcales bacterium]
MNALALAAVVAAGCQVATAQAPPEQGALQLGSVVTPPTEWTALPEVARAATATLGAAALAWGDPGRGCYAVVIGARAPRQNPEDALAELATRLTSDLGLTGWSSTGSDGGGQIARGPLTGSVRASARAVGVGAVVVVAACVANPREPAPCATLCQGVLASFDAAKVIP